MRGPTESYSDVILRLVEIEAKGGGQSAAGAMKQQQESAGQQNHAH